MTNYREILRLCGFGVNKIEIAANSQCGNLKTGVQKHCKDRIILNKFYQKPTECYKTTI